MLQSGVDDVFHFSSFQAKASNHPDELFLALSRPFELELGHSLANAIVQFGQRDSQFRRFSYHIRVARASRETIGAAARLPHEAISHRVARIWDGAANKRNANSTCTTGLY
jgi:hypothetical protein